MQPKGLQPFDLVGAVFQDFGDDEGPSTIIAQFANFPRAGTALNFHSARDNVPNFVCDEFAGGVDQVGCIESPVFSEEAEGLSGKHRLGLAQPEELIQVVGSSVILHDRRELREAKCFLKGEPASGATRWQSPTLRRTCFMKAAARVAESRMSMSTRIAKPVRSHMAAR